ncbi:unnamed protein product [Cylicocyclus nassatus]|uniref:Uncharacterized protein n=1 Tax=Cylicocyclus nassatus TaxID=53992 RepID=A0AA36GSQ5_CYLNA|nr:unnamed protein product [Cylicocyclus nassatus]
MKTAQKKTTEKPPYQDKKTVEELMRELNGLAAYTVSNFENPEETRDIMKGRKTLREEYLKGAWNTTSNGEDMLGGLREKQVQLELHLKCHEELLERRQRMKLPQAGQASPATSMGSMHMQSLLPRLKLPKFSGRRNSGMHSWQCLNKRR